MSRHRFETISCFFHASLPEEEQENSEDPLKKIRTVYDKLKRKCRELYHPLRELSIDEQMVKSKARTTFRQYIRNKPHKWGFKFWVLADPSGYTLDFNLYCGKKRTTPLSVHGLSYDVVMELVKPFVNQGYLAFFDNFYTSPTLINDLHDVGIGATGTLRLNRSGIPDAVKKLATALNKKDVARGTGYYIRERGSKLVYCCWKDNQCVTVLSTAYPGHTVSTAKRRGKDQSGQFASIDVPLPSAIQHYNQFMGGVDLSDQLIGYHPILCQTKRYWKTLLYHLVEIASANAFVLYKWQCISVGSKPPTESHFRDALVLGIIERHGTNNVYPDSYFTPHFCSMAIRNNKKRRCPVCHNARSRRQCNDCPFSPALCQNSKKDCHSLWHTPGYAVQRQRYFNAQKHRAEGYPLQCIPACRRSGRPAGVQKRRRKRLFS